MLSRRGFAGLLAAGFSEAAFAQRAAVKGAAPAGTVWLNANEFPEGPPQAALEAMSRVIGESNRYHYPEFQSFYKAIAASEKLDANQVLIGAGSSEVLHAAVDVFTSPKRPFITCWPTFEAGPELAEASGHPVVKLPLSASYASDVKKLVAEADKAGGGMIYLCNPNNPTSALTTKQDIAWTVANLPPQTTLLVDEAYFHFANSPDAESAIKYVREGKNVVVIRTFSKIYGMAGLRVGFAAAKPEYIEKLQPLQINVISIVSARAVTAALADKDNLVRERRATLAKTRRELCGWLHERGIKYIEPSANFMMIDCGRNAREFINTMPKLGVAPGRPFPPLDNMLRVTIGTDAEMAKFRDVFWKVYKG